MMRILPSILLLSLLLASVARAEKPVTVAQLDQILEANQGKSDGHIASQLSALTLTERVSYARLERWQSRFPGRHTREALILLADESAFRELPTTDLSPAPPPDLPAQGKLFGLVIGYVSKTVHNLPNFLADRETTHFEDSLHQALQQQSGSLTSGSALRSLGTPTQLSESTNYLPLHFVGHTSEPVAYRDGREVPNGPGHPIADLGLTTNGEFGPILSVVLDDAIHGRITWGYWQRSSAGPLAVFRYQVPPGGSHYRVEFHARAGLVEAYPAYHGEIAIDPATGSILHISVISDMSPPWETVGTGILVDYGPVAIGDRTYICPLRGVALSKMPVMQTPGAAPAPVSALQTRLNDVAFTNYHLFRAEARILAAEEAQHLGDEAPPSANAAPAPSSPVSGAVAPAISSSSPVATTEPVPSPPAAADTQQPAASVAQSGLASIANFPPTFHTGTNLVLLDVVVTDHNQPIHGLQQSRFHVFEDGNEQIITSFEERQPTPKAEAAAPVALPPHTWTNIPTRPESGTLNVLLLDGLNTPFAGQREVRRQMLQALSGIPAGTPLAVFTLGSRLQMITGFTTDAGRLVNAMQKVGSRPSIVLNAENSGASLVAAATRLAQADGSDPATMAQVLLMLQFAADTKEQETAQRIKITLDALDRLARYLSAIPGRKSLIWFSGSFPITLGADLALPDSDPLRNLSSYTDEIRRVGGQLSAARVAVYPVDARGLAPLPSVEASYLATPNLSTRKPAAENQSIPSNDNSNFVMQSSLEHASMNQIAEATGGHAWADTNGLGQAFQKILDDGRSYYTLGYVPSHQRLDGSFRRIEVRIDHAHYQLAYRRGYFAVNPDRPSGSSDDVALTAALVPGAPPATQILFEARALPVADQSPDTAPAPSVKKAEPWAIDLSIDPQSVAFAADGAGIRHAGLACILVASDADGQRITSLTRNLRIDIPPDQYTQLLAARTGIPVRFAIDLPPGPMALRIAVYDPASARVGSLEIALALPAGK